MVSTQRLNRDKVYIQGLEGFLKSCSGHMSYTELFFRAAVKWQLAVITKVV